MSRAYRLLACALATLLSGACVGVIPIPTARHTPKEYGTRGEIEKKYIKFLNDDATRTDVLLGLGEPDVANERYFFYRWITAGGRMPMWAMGESGGEADVASLGKKRHDLVIEFDEDGRVVRHGDVRKWTTKKVADPPAMDLASPVVLHVGHRHEGRSPASGMSLRLEQEALEMVGDRQEGHDLRLEVREILAIEYGSRQDDRWRLRKFAVDIRYLRDGKRQVLRLFVPLTLLPPFLDWVRLACPEVDIQT